MRNLALAFSMLGALAIGFAASSFGAPINRDALERAQAAGTVLEVQWQRCRWEDGSRICRYVFREGDWRYGYRDDDY